MDQLLIETYGTAVSKAFSGVNSTNAVALAVFLFVYFFSYLYFYPNTLIASINFSELEWQQSPVQGLSSSRHVHLEGREKLGTYWWSDNWDC